MEQKGGRNGMTEQNELTMTDLKRIFADCQEYQISYLLKTQNIPHRYERRMVFVKTDDLNEWLEKHRYQGPEKV